MELVEIKPPPPSQNQDKEGKEKDSTKNHHHINYVKYSFTITYILLLTTATITFIEAVRTKIPYVRHILNLETCISIVAGYFYGVFITQIERHENEGKPMDWNDITQTRYIDWAITTPMMLLTLCLVLSSHIQAKIHLFSFLLIVLLNYSMLLMGFLGEINVMDRITSDFFGFIAFFTMFALIFYWFVYPKYSRPNYILFMVYLLIWSMYGVVYMFNENLKNTLTNILDLTAKCLVGLGLWVYYTKIIRE
jgi:bacteriorhodopsin